MAIDLSALSTREALTAIYIGYYDRAADPAGIQFWEQVVANTSLDLVAITTDFANQAETQAVHPFFANPATSSPATFITSLYQNLFNRDPDAAGLAFWSDALQAAIDGDEGAITVGEIIVAIIEGAQDVDGGPQDATTIMNKIAVGLDWTNSVEAEGIVFDDDAAASARSIIDPVDETEASVVTAKAITDNFVEENKPGVPGQMFILNEGRESVSGTEGNDTFEAFNAELQDGDRIEGGSGTDALWYFNSVDGVAKAPITTSVEQVVVTNQMNDLNSVADNNVGGYSTTVGGDLLGNLPLDGTVEVDVEIDGGMMSGVTRWEDFDSRADLVIEDARDLDDTDGTFTGDITVAMVSTDPGNVDFAVYFDDPVNTSQNFGTLVINVLDQEAAFGLPAPTASSTGYLTESSLIEFTFAFDGQPITVTLPDAEGVTYGANVSFQDLLDQVEAATQQALVDAGVTENLGFSASLGAPVTVGVGNQFTLPLILTFDVPADTIEASSDDIIVLGRDSGNNGATPATDTFGSLSTVRITEEELIRLNVELDDVGKGSMGGDAMFGAMSTGRQDGDDGTSDSIGIQQFDIEVDRSSQLQTINSTNNALEVVNIVNGENDGPNNTTTAADEKIGDLVVRGRANPIDIENELEFILNAVGLGGIATDGPMPGAVPQHNSFGFSDVRVINAAQMIGSVDLTAELTAETVEKYLDIQDSQANGEADDVQFVYTLGTNDDEFLLQMSDAAMGSAGTGSREDFNMTTAGGAGNDVITTNIGADFNADFDASDVEFGGAIKVLDEQGQDHYLLTSTNANGWYENAVSNVAAEFSVDGGAGMDVIWTHGWGDFTISDGTGMDVVYTDNSGAFEISGRNGPNGTVVPGTALDAMIDRNLTEHEQIDYVYGAVWAYNAEFPDDAENAFDITGITNDRILVAEGTTLTNNLLSTGSVDVTVSYRGSGGDAGTDYNVTVQIPVSQMIVVPTATAGEFDIFVTDQSINQAIKNAVNDADYVMSNMLEAVDGPGNSLAIYTKSDGVHVEDDLQISMDNVVLNNEAPASLPTDGQTAFDASYAGTANDAPGRLFEAGVSNDDSNAESDNTIMVAGDGERDLFVLSTNDSVEGQPAAVAGSLDAASDLNGASNEVLMLNSNFGIDTVLNFDAATDDIGTTGTDESDNGVDGAEDVFDFTLITGVADHDLIGVDDSFETSTGSANGSVDIVETSTVADVNSSGTLDAADLIAAYGAGTSGSTSEHIVIVYDETGDNGGEVWHLTDNSSGTVSASYEGTINLVGTAWSSLGDDNFA